MASDLRVTSLNQAEIHGAKEVHGQLWPSTIRRRKDSSGGNGVEGPCEAV
jgi:hypothetical protein